MWGNGVWRERKMVNFPFAPLGVFRRFLGRCYIENYRRVECYRSSRYVPHLVAFQRSDGSWYIRRKYRWFYSERFLRELAGGRLPEQD